MAEVKHERITAEKVEKLEHRLGQVSMGYDTGALTRIYTQDVRYLLKEVELLQAEQVEAKKDIEHNNHLIEQLRIANERADLWQRDCEAATARVRELEVGAQYDEGDIREGQVHRG